MQRFAGVSLTLTRRAVVVQPTRRSISVARAIASSDSPPRRPIVLAATRRAALEVSAAVAPWVVHSSIPLCFTAVCAASGIGIASNLIRSCVWKRENDNSATGILISAGTIGLSSSVLLLGSVPLSSGSACSALVLYAVVTVSNVPFVLVANDVRETLFLEGCIYFVGAMVIAALIGGVLYRFVLSSVSPQQPSTTAEIL